MSEQQRVLPSPLAFRMRAAIIGLIYFFSFFFGFNLHALLYKNVTPTFVLLGAPWGAAGIRAWAYVAAAFAVLAFLVRVWGSSYLSSGIVWSETVKTGVLRVSGPYRYVRNPLYLGNILLAIGIGLLGPPIATVLAIAGNVIFVYVLIGIEERYLETAHGESYDRYRSMVPRLWPRLFPASFESGSQKGSLADGLSGEIFALGFALATLYNAVFDPVGFTPVVFYLLVGGFIVQFFVAISSRRIRTAR